MVRELELLAPAKNCDIAKGAILHGADAVYIGAPAFGARKEASNSIAEIQETVDFAHRFRCRVYVTVNTIIYDHELRQVEKMIRELYRAGVDALIIQDMSVLRMDIPPIPLHASTQCDTRTVEKARFLQEAGFSQIVLARELSLSEIKDIHNAVDIPLEGFVHGALCVSYSGRCHASFSVGGRSANRGECAQICRLPYTLLDGNGNTLIHNKHLLSLRDLNTSTNLHSLVDAGISSFKIEGRLKDMNYVKNVTASYSRTLDKLIRQYPDKYRRSSFGTSEINFNPDLRKSFNRGFTNYFLIERQPESIASIHTSKSQGEIISDTRLLNNGDGISFFNAKNEYDGVLVNGVTNDGRIIPSRRVDIPANATIYRTFDKEFDTLLKRPTASRKIYVDITIDETAISASDERGVHVRIPLDVKKDIARTPLKPENILSKLGETIYKLRNFSNRLLPTTFIPASALTALRRKLIDALDSANINTYPFMLRRKENRDAVYPTAEVDYRENISNSVAEQFYRQHGVRNITKALETGESKTAGKVVMTCRHCIMRETGHCLKRTSNPPKMPLTLTSGKIRFILRFDCKHCEMQLIKSV